MRTVTYRLADLEKKERVCIHLGRVDENEATRVQIDAGTLFAEYPAAAASMSVESPAGVKYPATVTRDGDMVIWDVRDSDLAKPGRGEMQLTFTENGVVVKSAIARTSVARSIVGEGTPPDPLADWIERAEDVLEEIEDAFPEGGTTGQVLAKKSDADFDTEWVDQGSGGTGDYEELENLPQIGGVELKGNKSLHDLGAAAESDIPDVSGFYTKPAGGVPASDLASAVQTSLGKADTAYQKPGSGIPATDLASGVQTSLGKADTAYQKPGSGIPASDIASGVIPDPASIIDDTSTAANKVLSAQKVSGELSDVKSAIDELNNVCGVGSTTQIIMPTGYKSANYSNAAGTLKFKWENNKLTLKKANGSAGEITTSNASLTIDETLTYEVTSGSNDEIIFDYDNDSEEDDDAFIGLRFCHKNNLNSYVSARVYIPSGTGTKSIKLTKIAEDYEVNLSDYKYLVIRSIKTETTAGATVYINGYKKTVASENISDRVTELEENATSTSEKIAELEVGENLYQNRYEDLGYLNTSTGELNLYSSDYVEKTSDFIDVITGDRIYIQTWVPATPKVRIGFFDNLKAFISGSQMPDSTATVLPDGTYYLDGYFDVPNNAKFIKVSYASYGITGKIKVTKNGILSDWSPAPIDVGSHVFNIADNYSLIGVAHMGKKNLAPENTAPSFIAAAQNGYKFVETDVRFTSDGVPVLIHDATINRVARNSDGTQLSTDVYIKDITYAEALEYDFGYAFNQSFAGTKIMRFVDFVILCKNLGLYPFIEIKNDDNLFTEAQIHTLVDIVDIYRMNEKSTWQSYSLKPLVWIKKYRPESRLMMSASPVTIKRILEVEYLRTAFNETVISADETAENIAMIKPHKLTMHTFASESEYDDIDPYITSVVSDDTNYETYVRNRELNT